MKNTQNDITTTLGALVDGEPALQRLTTLKLDAKTRYHAVKLRQLVAAETKHFVDQRNDLVRELGEEREPTGAERARLGPEKVTEVRTANLPEFRRRLAEIVAIPVTVPWGPVTSTMLDTHPEFTGDDMIALGPLFVLVDDAAASEPAKETATA